MMNTSKSRTDQCCESEFEDWEEKAGQLAKLCGELEKENNNLHSHLKDSVGKILFQVAEAKAARAEKERDEAEAEVNRLRTILSSPGQLRYHVQKQFPEYEWIDRQHYADLRRLAEEAERLLHSQNPLDGEPSI